MEMSAIHVSLSYNKSYNKIKNTVEMLISNMNYARVSGCVVTQEYIDGNQDHYLLECRKKYSKRIKICCLYEEKEIKFLGENARAFYGFEELEVTEKIRNMVEFDRVCIFGLGTTEMCSLEI